MSDDFTPLRFPRAETCDYIAPRGWEAEMDDDHIARVLAAWVDEERAA